MEKYIYINYAYEDQAQVMGIIRQLQAEGMKVCYGNGNEERVSGSLCVIHFCTAASHTSKTYRKIMNYTLKHEMDSMLFHLGESGIVSDVEAQLDVLHTLFKYKYRTAGIQSAENQAEKEIEPDADTVQKMYVDVSGEDAAQKEPDDAAETAIAGKASADVAEPDTARKAFADAAETDNVPAETGGIPGDVQTQQNDTVVEEKKPVEPAERPVTQKEALYLEGKRWLTGDGCDVDEKKAFVCFKQAANQGHTEAQYQLSICYDRGMGVRRSITEAAKWCQMAAYGGHAQAQSEIGYCYEYGQGVVRNIKEAVRWYQIASEQGNIEAKNNLAFCYQKGKGVLKNVDEAIRLYQEAADAGHASAQYNLGFCYWYGEGIESDKKKAIKLFQQSAANGNAKASQMLKILNQRAFLGQ